MFYNLKFDAELETSELEGEESPLVIEDLIVELNNFLEGFDQDIFIRIKITSGSEE